MRVADRAAPVYTPHPVGPAAPIAGWAATPRIVIERLPTYAYTWDDEDAAVVWDAAGDVYLWDDPATGGGYVDAVCDFQALEIVAGDPDELNLYPSARAVLSLDNRTGEWSQFDEAGRLVYYAPGRRLHVLADLAGETWWLFSGLIETWDLAADGRSRWRPTTGSPRWPPTSARTRRGWPGTGPGRGSPPCWPPPPTPARSGWTRAPSR